MTVVGVQPVGVQVGVDIVDVSCSVTMTHEFRNNHPTDTVEFTFVPQLSDRHATVVRVAATTPRGTVELELKEKQEAREVYEDAVSSGDAAFLTEEKKGGTLEIAVGSVWPGETVVVVYTYVCSLDVSTVDATRRLRIPLTTFTAAVLEGARGVPISLQGTVRSSTTTVAPPAVRCSALTAEGAGTKGRDFAFRGTLQEDVNLELDIPLPLEPHVEVEELPPGDRGLRAHPCASQLTFFPSLPEQQVASNIVFLLDRSGSMSGARMRALEAAMVAALKLLPLTCVFNIVGFGSAFETLFEDSVPVTPQNLAIAEEYVANMRADMGGTNVSPPLQWILEKQQEGKEELETLRSRQEICPGCCFEQETKPCPASGEADWRRYPTQIFFITDGRVHDADQCLALMQRNAHHARLFGFGVPPCDQSFVASLSDAGNGRSVTLEAGDEASLATVWSEQLRRALQPAYVEMKLETGGRDVIVTPSPLPPLWHQEMYKLWILHPGGEPGEDNTKPYELIATRVTGEVDRWVLPVTEATTHRTEGRTLHCMAARQLIATSHRSALDKTLPQTLRDRHKKWCTDLSLTYGILCPYTSFVAVQSDTRPALGPRHHEALSGEERPPPVSSGASTQSATSKPIPSQTVRSAKEVLKTQDYYDVLQVPRDATHEDIRRAYRKLAMRFHPDKGGPGNDATFSHLSRAYEVLGDEHQRNTYDKYGEEGVNNQAGGGACSDIFSQFFGGGGGAASKAASKAPALSVKKSPPIRYTHDLATFEDVFQGSCATFTHKYCVPCTVCMPHRCPHCTGGIQMVPRTLGPGMVMQMQVKCEECRGTGTRVGVKECKECMGEGTVRHVESLEVTIPAGVWSGYEVRIQDVGDHFPGQRRGDVVVTIRIPPPPKGFRRRRRDLVLTCPVSPHVALCGGTVALQIVGTRGWETIRGGLPPNFLAVPDVTWCLPNCGLPDVDDPRRRRGHVFVEFQVQWSSLRPLDLMTLRGTLPLASGEGTLPAVMARDMDVGVEVEDITDDPLGAFMCLHTCQE